MQLTVLCPVCIPYKTSFGIVEICFRLGRIDENFDRRGMTGGGGLYSKDIVSFLFLGYVLHV